MTDQQTSHAMRPISEIRTKEDAEAAWVSAIRHLSFAQIGEILHSPSGYVGTAGRVKGVYQLLLRYNSELARPYSQGGGQHQPI